MRRFLAVLGTALLSLLTVLALTPAASAAPLARTVYYNASAAGEFRSVADQAAQIWNQRVPNVRLVAGGAATMTIGVTTGGGSRAYPQGLGRGRVLIDRNDVNAGHYALRIMAHEIGHILGLPDNYNGVCAQLMSGGSAGTSCRNPNPNAQESARVNQLFAGGFRAAPVTPEVYAPAA
ncbi:snapalysin [Crossiella equi]|uniref:Extracellular small neutral protease n=1 Tax=Crossiella equi TaxID=130796 RepID=A0ABS5A9X0_9PSEU|nr:snapalysin family zinc-dependent metalloprotease [Crossiella equi]MBP2473388.1 snapalysin [Crossiella equi]